MTRASKRVAGVLPLAFPSEAICETICSLFFESIDSFGARADQVEARATLARALSKMEATSKALKLLLRSNKRLPYYRMFYHSLAANAASAALPMRFLDATFGIELFSGEYGIGPSQLERFSSLTPRDVLQDRINSSKRLSELDEVQILQRSAHYIPQTLPTGVGKRVAAFVGRARFLTQLRAETRPEWVTTCGLCTCNRRMLCSDAGATAHVASNPALNDVFGEDDDSSDDEDDGDDGDDNRDPTSVPSQYWSSLSPKPIATAPKRFFCSHACALAFEDELGAAVPVRVVDADRHESFGSASGKTGLARVLASTRAAFKRNDAAARALREAARRLKREQRFTLKLETYNRMHTNVVDILNVDLGLLYAAAALAESPEACQNRALPATSPGWRDGNIQRFRRAIERVKAIYMQHHRPRDGLATDERFPPCWLRKVREAAPTLFPSVQPQTI